MSNLEYVSVEKRRIPYRELPAQIQSLPPLPHTLQRLLEIMQDEHSSASDLEGVIQQDEALLSKVLRTANSAYYGLRGKIGTVARAIMTVGFHEIQSICLCALLMESFSDQTSTGKSERESLWKHSLATANLARWIVKGRPWISQDDAYVLGLLHDLGRLVMLIYLKEDYQNILHLAERGSMQLWEAESQYHLTHTQIGKWIAIRWHLPEAYQKVMMFHHSPYECPSFEPSVKVVHLANVLAHFREFPEPVHSHLTMDCLRDLCISEEEWMEHTCRVERVLEEVEALWKCLG